MERSSASENAFLRMLAYLCIASLVIALLLSILSNNIMRTLFSPDDISEPIVSFLIIRGGVRDQMVEVMLSDIWEQGLPSGENPLKSISPQDRTKVVQLLFPKDWFIEQVRENLDALFSWLESDNPLPDLRIDLISLERSLVDGKSYEIAEIVVDSWPQCSIAQERQLDRALQPNSSVRFEFCRPDGDLRQRLIDNVDQRIHQYIKDAPENVPLFEGMISDENTRGFDEFRQSALRLMLLLNILIPLPFVFLGLIMAVIIRSWPMLGRWWGIPLGIGALLTLFLILLGHLIGPGLLKNSLNQFERFPEYQETMVDVVWDFLATILNRSAIQAVLTGVIGLAAFLVTRRRKNQPEVVRQPVDENNSSPSFDEIPPPPQVKPFDPDEQNLPDHGNES